MEVRYLLTSFARRRWHIASLVPIERFTAATGATLEPAELAKAQVLLEDISALVVSFTGRDFQWHADAEITVWEPNFWSVPLPWSVRPVHAVKKVTCNSEPVTAYKYEAGEVRATEYPWLGPVTVTLDYGYQAVPADVQAVVLVETLARFNSEPGIAQEQIGDILTGFRSSIPTLSRDARRALRRYRQSVGVIRL
ncbi:hypothetical protein ACFWY5_29895 [Nonomuraea sp. NPDC059007]|uniref:hypothetical protein n=1 Tax=Nonomuraea sp. NPDC059007 TaxID=3346692 RepID=UPI0036CCFE08